MFWSTLNVFRSTIRGTSKVLDVYNSKICFKMTFSCLYLNIQRYDSINYILRLIRLNISYHCVFFPYEIVKHWFFLLKTADISIFSFHNSYILFDGLTYYLIVTKTLCNNIWLMTNRNFFTHAFHIWDNISPGVHNNNNLNTCQWRAK